MPPDPDNEFIGRYSIRRKIGNGGMGVVYLADDQQLGRDVAIKVIRTELFRPGAELDAIHQRFEAEAQAAARLNHPGIVTVYDYGDDRDRKYIVMEYVEGGNLGELVANGKASRMQIPQILNQVASALDYAHKNKVIHRDIKPSNIVVDHYGAAKITDFGTAKMDLRGHTLTSAGTVVGTPAYMSPEQLRGEPVTSDADRWGLAVTAYEALTHRKPFHGENIEELKQLIFEGRFESPMLMNSGSGQTFPAGLEGVFRRALAVHRVDRYPTCSSFADDLCSVLNQTQRFEVRPSANTPPDATNRAYNECDFGTAFTGYHKAASAGDASAMYNVALFFDKGLGVAQNAKEAIGWYQKAADAGASSAMNALGVVYEYGKGVPANRAKAISWYQAAVKAGNPRAADNLKRLGINVPTRTK